MTAGDKRIFAGLLTVEFTAAGKGCRMVMTEQGAFLDGHDIPANHEAGWDDPLIRYDVEVLRFVEVGFAALRTEAAPFAAAHLELEAVDGGFSQALAGRAPAQQSFRAHKTRDGDAS